MIPVRRLWPMCIAIAVAAGGALWIAGRHADQPPKPVIVAGIQVIDGDTVRSGGTVYRLVGFDAPESGANARCQEERALADRATARLRGIVAAGGVQLIPVACACRPGTEGTRRCNYGRLCGTLTARGRDVAAIMIGEGLARPYICGATSCPRRQSWCD